MKKITMKKFKDLIKTNRMMDEPREPFILVSELKEFIKNKRNAVILTKNNLDKMPKIVTLNINYASSYLDGMRDAFDEVLL